MPTDPHHLNRLAAEYLSNSARWFPDLHHGNRTAAVHFALGLAGEIGELVELVAFTEPGDPTDPKIGEELADVTIYTLDLGGVLGLDLDAGYQQAAEHASGLWPDLVIAAGLVANITKKLNRGDTVEPEQLARLVCRLLAECFEFALAERIDLLAEMASKVLVCEARWGGSRG